MRNDPLIKARCLRQAAALIIRHCKTPGAGLNPDTGVMRAWLRDEAYYEEAGVMLARRGFGMLSRSETAGRGNVFTLKTID